MPVKKYKPTTPGRRHSSVQDFSDITKKEPEKSLVVPLKKNAARVGGGYHVRAGLFDGAHLRREYPDRKLALADGVRAAGAAAQRRARQLHEVDAGDCRQQLPGRGSHALGVGQVARVLVGDAVVQARRRRLER